MDRLHQDLDSSGKIFLRGDLNDHIGKGGRGHVMERKMSPIMGY